MEKKPVTIPLTRYDCITKETKQMGVLRKAYVEGMQEFLCSDGKAIYEKQERIKINKKIAYQKSIDNRLPFDSEEQLHYNAVIASIIDYKDWDEYKYKNSFKYKFLKFFRLKK